MLSSPLKAHYFQILLALSAEDRHGYGIQRAVLDQTDDGMRLWPAMLYRSLAKLEEAELIRRVDHPDGAPDDERRQYYALTARGRERLRTEAEMLSRWAEAATRRSRA